jgi:hypothetical protein
MACGAQDAKVRVPGPPATASWLAVQAGGRAPAPVVLEGAARGGGCRLGWRGCCADGMRLNRHSRADLPTSTAPANPLGWRRCNSAPGGAGASPHNQRASNLWVAQPRARSSVHLAHLSRPPSPPRSPPPAAGSLTQRKEAPHKVCCNALLAAYARACPPQWRRALRLLELMAACGGELAPDIVSFNTAMKGAGNAGRTDAAFQARGCGWLGWRLAAALGWARAAAPAGQRAAGAALRTCRSQPPRTCRPQPPHTPVNPRTRRCTAPCARAAWSRPPPPLAP